MAILNNSNAISTTGGYDINNSLRFRRSASAYLNRTPASATNQKTWTLSIWLKRGELSTEQNIFGARSSGANQLLICRLDAGNNLIIFARNSSSTTVADYATAAVFRDPSAWYHIVVAIDTTQATSANRLIIYINGTQQTLTTTTAVPQNTDLTVNSIIEHGIGFHPTTGEYVDGYLAETYFVDGQQLTPSSFGETSTTTGSWIPKAYTGTYGTNGFYLKFSDIATTSGSNAGLGKDFSGNANYWTTNNISVTAGTTYDAMIDSPTLTSATVANYATFNLLNNTGGSKTFAEGNLKVTGGGAAVNSTEYPTFQLPSGKWYFEGTVGAVGAASITGIGTSDFFYQADGSVYPSGSVASFTTNDVIGVAIDVDAGTVQFYKNGVSQITKTGTAGATVLPAFALGGSATAPIWYANFGQRPFSYTPPTGFNRLNTFNLPDSTIKKGSSYMQPLLYTGDGTSSRSITGVGFQPDLIWVKNRSNAVSHCLVDAVRGAPNQLGTDLTAAENSGGNDRTLYGGISAIGSNGFTVVTGSDPTYKATNGNTQTYVAWNWKANGAGSSNTSGSIASTVSVNTTAGFSVVTYTGTGANATVGHGLGVVPKMMIVKNRGVGTTNWLVYHSTLTGTSALYLNTTEATQTFSDIWNNTAPTSTVISLGTTNNANASANTYVAYCWAEVDGYSKFGSYTGNGSADGPFQYTGFRPKFLLVRITNTAGYGWNLVDTSRDTSNVAKLRLSLGTSNAEDSGSVNFDLLSNGFKVRDSGIGINENGSNYIYMAFAESPFKFSNAR